MQSPRRLILTHRRLATALLVLTMALRVVVPVGFMPVLSGGGIVMTICSSAAPLAMVTAHAATGHHEPGDPQGSDKQAGRSQPCTFAALSSPGLAAEAPLLPAQAILIALDIASWIPALPPTVSRPYLNPPTTGPPPTI